MPSTRLVALALPVALMASTATAWAQDRGEPDRGGRGHERGNDRQGLSDSVRRVERRTGGQVLSAERVPYDGRDVNRVKVVDSSGRVRIYMDDPQQARDRQPQQQQDRTRRDDD